MTTELASTTSLNVAERLREIARRIPDELAIAEAAGRNADGRWTYRRVTFRELDRDTDRLAAGLVDLGVHTGTRLALFVPMGIDFISLVFALFKAGAVVVLIDPGMGPRQLMDCLDEVQPQGFIAVPALQALRLLPGSRYGGMRFNVTVGRRWFWRGPTLAGLRRRGEAISCEAAATQPSDSAAIIFTSGSTGPAKGVLYSHENFDRQVSELQAFYGIQAGEIDVPCFPLFGLFNAALGVTTILPRIDFRRPARVDPQRLVAAIEEWKATQSFASPTVWDSVGRYCEENNVRLPTVRRLLAAGAPVPAAVLRRLSGRIHPEGEIHTPYGATEALPVASIGAAEVLAETGRQTDAGSGVCVGRRFPGIEWRVIRIVDGPIASIADAAELPPGEIGELIVRGPVVTERYVTRTQFNRLAKIPDPAAQGYQRQWHRMGDVGYLDSRERFWFCGRLSHRVLTAAGPMYTIPCEAIFNRHPEVRRSALVGVGRPGAQQPVIVVEPTWSKIPHRRASASRLVGELRTLALTSPLTAEIRTFLVRRRLPVDIRHNAKISREWLSIWATRRV